MKHFAQAFTALGVLGMLIAAWATNLIWVFTNTWQGSGRFIIAVIGILMAPVGVLHGIYSWFC